MRSETLEIGILAANSSEFRFCRKGEGVLLREGDGAFVSGGEQGPDGMSDGGGDGDDDDDDDELGELEGLPIRFVLFLFSFLSEEGVWLLLFDGPAAAASEEIDLRDVRSSSECWDVFFWVPEVDGLGDDVP